MIEKILHYSNIGTPSYLVQLISYANSSTYTEKELKDFFFRKSIDNRYIFDGGVHFLNLIGFFIKNKSNNIEINKSFLHFLENDYLLIEKINSLFLVQLTQSDLFKKLFNKSTMFYEQDGALVISSAAFKFKYAIIRQFLLDFNVISKHPYINKNYLVNNNYQSYFNSIEISKKNEQRILTLDEFKKLQELKNTYGENAENFVVDYEKNKFKSHELVESIEKISNFNMSAGFDVVSLQGNDSNIIDKYIEVKSYSNNKTFFWSKNEVEMAKNKKNNYFLYLVNQKKIDNPEYTPIMIQNPYKDIFLSSNWNMECQSWFFKEKK
jgi:hypothetical protein